MGRSPPVLFENQLTLTTILIHIIQSCTRHRSLEPSGNDLFEHPSFRRKLGTSFRLFRATATYRVIQCFSVRQPWPESADDERVRATPTSDAIQRILSQLKVRVSFRPHTTLCQQLVHPKDPVPQDQKANVFYSIPCSTCLASYIIQTGRLCKPDYYEIV